MALAGSSYSDQALHQVSDVCGHLPRCGRTSDGGAEEPMSQVLALVNVLPSTAKGMWHMWSRGGIWDVAVRPITWEGPGQSKRLPRGWGQREQAMWQGKQEDEQLWDQRMGQGMKTASTPRHSRRNKASRKHTGRPTPRCPPGGTDFPLLTSGNVRS